MVKVYYINVEALEDEDIFELNYKKVNEQRRSKLLRLKNKKNKLQSLGAGVLLKSALLEEGLDYEKLVFEVGEHGMPFISNVSGVFYNLSHAGNYAACVISDNIVGIDIEAISKFEKGSKIMNRCYLDKEIEFCRSGRDDKEFLPERQALIWTRKEAFSKAMGMGLQLDFKSIDTLDERKFCNWVIDSKMQLGIYTKEIEKRIGDPVNMTHILYV